MKDKRDECGCHRDCTIADDILGIPPHECEKPCRWPKCMTEEEDRELIREMNEEGL